jgi:hypothetical protein
VRHALVAEEKRQRFAARAAGVGSSQAPRFCGFEVLDIGAYQRLRQERQARKIADRSHVIGDHAPLAQRVAVIRNLRRRVRQELAQALELQRDQLHAVEPLRPFQRAPHGGRVVSLQPLVERKQHAGREPRVQVGGHRRLRDFSRDRTREPRRSIQRVQALADVRPRVLLDIGQPFGAQPCCQYIVTNEAQYRRRHRVGIRGRNEKRRSLVRDQVTDAAHVGGHDRRAGRERLEYRVWHVVDEARVHGDIGFPIQRRDFVTIEAAEKRRTQ